MAFDVSIHRSVFCKYVGQFCRNASHKLDSAGIDFLQGVAVFWDVALLVVQSGRVVQLVLSESPLSEILDLVKTPIG